MRLLLGAALKACDSRWTEVRRIRQYQEQERACPCDRSRSGFSQSKRSKPRESQSMADSDLQIMTFVMECGLVSGGIE